MEQGAVRPWLASPQMVGCGGEHWLRLPQLTPRGDALPWIVDFSLMHLVEGGCPGKRQGDALQGTSESLGALRQGPDLRGLALGRHSYMCDSSMPFERLN